MERACLLTYQNFFKLWQFQRLSTTTVTTKDTVQTIISPFFPFSLTLITNKIFNAYKKSFLFSLNSYKFIHSIFIRISELIVPITVLILAIQLLQNYIFTHDVFEIFFSSRRNTKFVTRIRGSKSGLRSLPNLTNFPPFACLSSSYSLSP